ncbi:serine hydrolase [Leptothermofonsia sp. ETS-13]|uniref:serine hydrolase n=1 Tax=Leptothermofonsia sp. ETS-13 TaxID=3035696 RepID=UPI003BA0CF42
MADSRVSGKGKSQEPGSFSLWQRLFGRRSQRSSRRTGGSAGGANRTNNVRDDLDLSRDRFQSLRIDQDRRPEWTNRRTDAPSYDEDRQTFGGRSRNHSNYLRQTDIFQFPARDRSGANASTCDAFTHKVSKPEPPGRNGQENGYRSRRLRSPAAETYSRPLTVLPSSAQNRSPDQSKLGLRRDSQQQLEGAMVAAFRPGMVVSGNGGDGPRSQTAGRSRRRSATSPRHRSRGFSAVLYATRLLILSIGIGVLSGTILSISDPANRSLTSQQPVKQAGVTSSGSEGASSSQLAKVGQEMTTLKLAMQALITKTPQMTPGVFVMDLDTNAYVDLNGTASFSSASTIKVPILIAFFQDVDEGKIRLDEQLVLRKELIGGGSGDMQYDAPGTKYTALDVATRMITISDNTATNMLIARLGGIRLLNQRFKSWGLSTTIINNLLPDLEGTNTTTPKELALLLARISQGELVTMRSRDRLLDIMRRTENHSQLRQGLGNGAIIAHKTGDIGSLIGDTGLVDLPNGKRYVITVMIKRSHNDDRAYDYVNQLSRLAYLYFSRPAETPKVMTSPTTPSTQPSLGASSETPLSPETPSEGSGEESNTTDGAEATTL